MLNIVFWRYIFMKSRMINKQPKMLLLYGIIGEKLDSLLEITKLENIIVRQVMPSEIDIKISQLLKVSQLSLETYPKECEECIFMVGFDKLSMDRFLNVLKNKNISIPLKAMITPINRTWTFSELLKELSKEHEKFSKK